MASKQMICYHNFIYSALWQFSPNLCSAKLRQYFHRRSYPDQSYLRIPIGTNERPDRPAAVCMIPAIKVWMQGHATVTHHLDPGFGADL